MKLFAINPGSTSTKLACYREKRYEKVTLEHGRSQIDRFKTIPDQLPFRIEKIHETMTEKGWDKINFDAYVGRGGFIRPVAGGVYLVTDALAADLYQGISGSHASNLGGIIAKAMADPTATPAYIVDPVVVDELWDIARFSGLLGIERKSFFHALNHKAAARKIADRLKRPYEDLSLIVAHLGGGISVGAHRMGQVVDVNNALSGDGPFSPERSGGLPVSGICDFMSKHHEYPGEFIDRIARRGGVYSYTGDVDIPALVKKAQQKEEKATRILNAMIYQISKEIGALSIIFKGNTDAILLTGGMAFSSWIISRIKENVAFIAPVFVLPGEFEMEALIDGAIRVLSGIETPKEYV